MDFKFGMMILETISYNVESELLIYKFLQNNFLITIIFEMMNPLGHLQEISETSLNLGIRT